MALQANPPSPLLLPHWGNKIRQLFGGENRSFLSSDLLEDLQLQAAAIPNHHLQLFGALPTTPNDQQHALVAATFNGMGNDLPCNLLGSRKRYKESEEFMSSPGQQHLSIPILEFLENQGSSHAALHQIVGGVSTGLRLVFDDEQLNSSITLASGRADSSTLLSVLGEQLVSEMQRQREEILQYIELQGDHLKQFLEERRHRHLKAFCTLIEQVITKNLEEKELEVDQAKHKYVELKDRVKQLSLETHAWQSKAKVNEAMVTALRSNLQHAVVQSREQSREGCGDSEAADGATFHHGGKEDVYAKAFQENIEMKEHRSCRVCHINEVCMLLLPCKHLCLCKDCECRLDLCPLCRSLKNASVQVYMS